MVELETSLEFFELSKAISRDELEPGYFEHQYQGELEYGDVAELETEFRERMEDVREIHDEGYQPVDFEDMYASEIFLSVHPDMDTEEVAERGILSEEEVLDILRSFEQEGLVETRENAQETDYFYGPSAHPYLYLAGQVEELLSMAEERNEEVEQEPDEPGEDEEKSLHEIADELLDERADMEWEQEEETEIDARDLTGSEEVEATTEEPEEGGGPEWF